MYLIGESIANRYLVKQVFQGGMGIVYICYDQKENEVIALKTIKDQFLKSITRWEKFVNEIQTWISIGSHPNIVHAKKIEQVDGNFYIFMEYVSSHPNLSPSLRGRMIKGITNLDYSLEIMLQLSNGLSYAQMKVPGIVHRDLKPENILITADNIVKITDFGLAHISRRNTNIQTDLLEDIPQNQFHSFFTSSGNIAGTPPYMSPEQTRGEVLDARSDIYSLGCIFYELVTGKWLSDYTTPSDWFAFHRFGKPILPSVFRPIPHDLELVIIKCLEKQKEARYQNLEELIGDVSSIYKNLTNRVYCLPESNTTTTENEDIDKGRTFLETGLADIAINQFLYVLNNNPTSLKAMIGLSSSLIQVRRLDEAIKYCEKAYTMSAEIEHKARALSNKGLALLLQKRYNDAIAELKKATEMMPTLMTSWNNLGIAYEESGFLTEGLECYEKAIKCDPWHRAGWTNKARILQNSGNKAEALICYRQSISYSLTIIDKITGLFSLWNTPDFDQVDIQDRNYLIKAVDLLEIPDNQLKSLIQDKNPITELLPAFVSLDSTDVLKSRNDAIVFLKSMMKMLLFLRDLEYFIKRNDDKEVRDCLHKLSNYILSLEKTTIDSEIIGKDFFKNISGIYFSISASSMINIDRYDLSIWFLEKAFALGFKTPLLYALYGFCLFSINDWEKALPFIDKALENDLVVPKKYDITIELWIMRGRIKMSHGDFRSAINCFDKALLLDLSNREAIELKRYCSIQLQLGKSSID